MMSVRSWKQLPLPRCLGGDFFKLDLTSLPPSDDEGEFNKLSSELSSELNNARYIRQRMSDQRKYWANHSNHRINS
jgi:hypothetical protein